MAGRFGAAAAAKVEVQIVGPVAEQLALHAEIDAPEIGSARKVGAIGGGQRRAFRGLRVVAPVELPERADRSGELSVAGGNGGAAIVDLDLRCGRFLGLLL